MLLTMKMKKITVCFTCLRSLLICSSGRMSTMEAPVVPMKLARRAPSSRMRALVPVCAGTSPVSRMPPLMV